MNYGFECFGSAGQAVVDSEHGLLHVMSEGVYSGAVVISKDGTYAVVDVSYSSAIVTEYPPVVFISPGSIGVHFYFQHKGRPGSWTGFTFRVGYYESVASGFLTAGKYCACGMNPESVPGYGMQVRDASARLVFDGAYKIMNFLGGGQVWPPYFFLNLTMFQGAWIYRLPWVYGREAYFMVSHFGQAYSNSLTLGDVSIGFSDSSRSYIEISNITFKVPAPIMNWPLLVAMP
ncbi:MULTISPECIES: hypothetical protein [unclassified Pseudomonas]|uniref:hypothetical protein n=1 Tax=unclassified Pseudomonas TaxID=196821 RepID=UPI00076CA254|nr:MULTISPECIES: hypothetical protein [unclassified Pseudomonas]KVV01749.1 hypothetical protein AP060_03469 [Pseudomonas sp. TAD18]KVV03319.1 hypothetical protein AP059_03703 [Pseudomonas sp. TAA207]